MGDIEFAHVTAPMITFEDVESVHEVIIPDGHAACVLQHGALPARVDLSPGAHVLTGSSFDEFEPPFVIIVITAECASALSRSKQAIDLTEAALN